MTNTGSKQDASAVVSTGAGIAIAGVWLAASAVTIFILYIMFGTSAAQAADMSEVDVDMFGFGVLIVIIGLPMIAAYNMSKLILSKED